MATKITKIQTTTKKISGRGGLSLTLRYIEKTSLYNLISHNLSKVLNKEHKGLKLQAFIKQIIAFLIDGTHTAIRHFDDLKMDAGYAAVLESSTEKLASSHQIKRYFAKLSIFNHPIFNNILHDMFLWRLKIENPKIIILGIDTMVLDNDDAKSREGCEPTYKKKKGFQPLHISWGSYLIDVLFRKGSAHSNHKTDYTDRVSSVVNFIRKRYREDVPIILCADSGFADQKAYEYFEETLKIHFITTSRIYKDTKNYISELPRDLFSNFSRNRMQWDFIELGSKLKNWSKFRRCIYTRVNTEEDGQYVLDFAKSDNLIYTNIGNCKKADEKLKQAGGEHYFSAEAIVKLSHQRGADELIHRSIKELATKEQLPFKKFKMNRAYYFMLVITHFMMETYKRDVASDVVAITAYPNTVRRKLIDFAVQITKGARAVVLNVNKRIYDTININELWKKCQSPPIITYI